MSDTKTERTSAEHIRTLVNDYRQGNIPVSAFNAGVTDIAMQLIEAGAVPPGGFPLDVSLVWNCMGDYDSAIDRWISGNVAESCLLRCLSDAQTWFDAIDRNRERKERSAA